MTLIVPFTPGSGPDAVAACHRAAPVRAHRHAGGDREQGRRRGNIGADLAAKAKPDGSTLMVTVNSFNVTPALYRKLPYDPVADFTPISMLGASNLALVVNAGVPAQTLEQLVALAKAKPGTLSYSSPGAGTTPHLAMEVFKKRYGLDILHVPYRGSAGATTDLVGGQTQLMMIPVHTGLPFVKQGRLRMLAVVRDTRSPFRAGGSEPGRVRRGQPRSRRRCSGCRARRGLPAAEVARLNREVQAVLAMPDVKEAFAAQGITPEGSTPAQLGDYIRNDIARWKKFVTEQNITLD
jgi:tripartite-type tricarboxylate transporter receptor subunit TctC